MTAIRIGIIGSGFMGITHCKAVTDVSCTKLVAVAGGRRAAKLASDFHVALEPSPEALMCREDIDAVVLATPHFVHAQHGLLALRSGKHVLIEKPMATSVEDCDALLNAARQAGRVLSVGFHQRFRNNNKLARSYIEQGALGDLQAVQVSMISSSDSLLADSGFGGNWAWWLDPRSVGDVLNTGPHAIDTLRWLTGSEVRSVAALCRTFRPGAPVEDTTVSLLDFANGAVCTFMSSSIAPAPGFPGEEFRLRLVGSKAVMDLDPYSEVRLSTDGELRAVGVQPTVGQQSSTLLGEARMGAFCDQIRAFVDAIEGKPSGIGTGEDGRIAVKMCLAMLEASRSQTVLTF
jgi:predicted dehydrogenase